MARYRGPSCKLCRAAGDKLFLKGDRCLTSKCAIVRRNTKPGDNRNTRFKKSTYAVQLEEKQKIKRIYGLLEKQFANYFEKANKAEGITGHQLLIMLERRLDNVIYRAGLAKSRSQARQFVIHGHVRIADGKRDGRVDIPSYLVSEGEQIFFSEDVKLAAENLKDNKNLPAWIKAQNNGFLISALPTRDDIGMDVKEQLVVEFYSR